MIINSLWLWIDRRTPGKHLETTPTSSSWCGPSRLFRSRSAGFLCELHHSGDNAASLCEGAPDSEEDSFKLFLFMDVNRDEPAQRSQLRLQLVFVFRTEEILSQLFC